MIPPRGTMSAQERAHLAASSEARQQSWRGRLVLAAATAALSAVWIHWWALVWLGAIVITEYLVAPWFRERFLRGGGADQAGWPVMIWRVIMATLYAFSWAPAPPGRGATFRPTLPQSSAAPQNSRSEAR